LGTPSVGISGGRAINLRGANSVVDLWWRRARLGHRLHRALLCAHAQRAMRPRSPPPRRRPGRSFGVPHARARRGTASPSGRFVAAAFLHRTSSAPDPHLHSKMVDAVRAEFAGHGQGQSGDSQRSNMRRRRWLTRSVQFLEGGSESSGSHHRVGVRRSVGGTQRLSRSGVARWRRICPFAGDAGVWAGLR